MARLLTLATVLASALSADPFNWRPCPGVADPQVQCGSLDVPLNYKDPSNPATIAIAVRRYRTSAAPPLGTILVNPGGPGVGGSQFANAQMAFILGGGYDVLGFDPRGLGASREVKCSRDGATAAKEVADLRKLLDPFDGELTDAQFHHVAAQYALAPARCKRYDSNYLPYLSTAFVARDMDRIRAALNQDLVHYYGVSYGTVLGVIYANLFPSRVGRFVLDSVVDPSVYTGATPKLLATAIADMETIFEAFGAECEAAGPAQCPLATARAQRPYVAKKLRALFASTDVNPLIVSGGDDVTLVTGRDLRTAMLPPMYAPSLWSSFATYAAAAMQGNVSGAPSENVCTVDASSSRLANMGYSMYLAHDGDLRASAAATWAHGLRAAKKASPLFGPMWFSLGLPAKAWTTLPVERYAGPWNAPLKNKILILNNELDPVTPLRSAKHTADLLGSRNAVLVTRQGYGHGAAFSQPSKCIHDVVVGFLNNGTYPGVKHCNVDTSPFALPQARSALDDELIAATKAVSADIVEAMRLL